MFLPCLDLDSSCLIGKERILEHGAEFIRILLERVETHVVVYVQFRFELYAFALEQLDKLLIWWYLMAWVHT